MKPTCLLLAALLALAPSAQAQQNIEISSTFTDFTSWTLLGSATAQNQMPGNGFSYSDLILTSPGTGEQAGAGWAPQALVLDVDQSFHVGFNFFIAPGSIRGDGFTFTLSTATGLGNAGSGLGYEGLDSSLAFAVDTFNFEGDPVSPSVQLLQNGSVTPLAVTETGLGDAIRDPNFQWWATLDWTPSGLEDHQGLLTGTISHIDLGSFSVQAQMDLSNLAGEPVFYGFTASNGLADDGHFITSAVAVPEPAPWLLILAGVGLALRFTRRL